MRKEKLRSGVLPLSSPDGIGLVRWMQTSDDDWYVSTNTVSTISRDVAHDRSGDGWSVARGHYSTVRMECVTHISTFIFPVLPVNTHIDNCTRPISL